LFITEHSVKCALEEEYQKRSKITMHDYLHHYINGQWTASTGSEKLAVKNPATEEVIGHISAGTEEDLDKAVRAARKAFPRFSQTTREYRVELLERIAEEYAKRKDDLTKVITEELGAPRALSEKVHYTMGYNHFKQAAEELRHFTFVEKRAASTIVKEPIGVS